MAAAKNTLNRKEVKYVLSPRQRDALTAAVAACLEPGEFGRSRVSSIYLDTPGFDVVARSVEKPYYKEKLRVRWYGDGSLEEVPVAFVELKKKLAGIVYKRRLPVAPRVARAFLEGPVDSCILASVEPCPHTRRGDACGVAPRDGAGCAPPPEDDAFVRLQVARELAAARERMQARGTLSASALVSCERTAYGSDDAGGLRVTFDENLRGEDVRTGRAFALLDEGWAVMEVKCIGGYPPWLVRTLDAAAAYPQSFSKYGELYRRTAASVPAMAADAARCEPLRASAALCAGSRLRLRWPANAIARLRPSIPLTR